VAVGRRCRLGPVIESVDGRGLLRLLCCELGRGELGRAVSGSWVEAAPRRVAVGRRCRLGPVIETVNGRGLLRLLCGNLGRAVSGSWVEAAPRRVAVGRLREPGPVIESVASRGLLRLLCGSVGRAVGGSWVEAAAPRVAVGRLCELRPVIESVAGRGLLRLLCCELDRAVSGSRVAAAPRRVTVGGPCELVPVIENSGLPHVAVDVANNLAGGTQFRCYSLVVSALPVVIRKMRPKARSDSAKVPTAGRSRLRPRSKIRGSRLYSGRAPRLLGGDHHTPDLTRPGNRLSRPLEHLASHG